MVVQVFCRGIVLEIVESEDSISYPYVVFSDLHLHNWSQFSHTLPNGRNNRLQQILDAIHLGVKKLIEAGGRHIVITGDLFHTRGVVKPSVLNPVIDLFRRICAYDIKVHSIPGNHDLEGTNSDSLGNAMHSLTSIPNFNCYTAPTFLKRSNHLFVPWFEDSQKTLKLGNEKAKQYPNLTLFAHVGLNGVIPARIGNTLDPKDFLKEDYKYVFCGHFHNHVSFDARAYSVGALTHQTWSDIGSKAGFLIVHEELVEHFETEAPKFLHIPEDSFGIGNVNNCYVRFGGNQSEESAKELKELLLKNGALAVLDQSTRPSLIEKRHEHLVTVDLGIDKALEAYCKHTFGDDWEKIYNECVKLKS